MMEYTVGGGAVLLAAAMAFGSIALLCATAYSCCCRMFAAPRNRLEIGGLESDDDYRARIMKARMCSVKHDIRVATGADLDAIGGVYMPRREPLIHRGGSIADMEKVLDIATKEKR